MEQHVEEITSYCQEYVIGGSDKEPVKLLARGIRTTQYDLHKLVLVLGPHLTSLEEIRRARSTSLLSEVLEQLPEYRLTDGEVQHLITFYCDRLKDKVSVIPHVLFGLQVIISYQLISKEQVVQVTQAIFKELYVQSLPVVDRKIVFTIFSSFLTNHIEAVKIIGSDFVFGYIQAIDGEKDPRNLLIIFKSSLLVIHYLPIDNFVEDLFEVSACYFPIDFTPPANDPHHITRDDLVNALRAVLCATPLFAELCLPLLMEKLSSDVHSAKIDSLLTLAAASEVYRNVIVKHIEQVWSAIRNEGNVLGFYLFPGIATIMPSVVMIDNNPLTGRQIFVFEVEIATDITMSDNIPYLAKNNALELLVYKILVYDSVSQSVEEACHVAIRNITRCLSVVVTKSNSDLLKWVGLILQDCKRQFSSPDLKLLPPTGQLLCCVAEGSESACHSILSVILPLLVEQCKLHHQMNEKKLIITVLLSFLKVSQSLVPDTTSDTTMDITSDTVKDTVTPLMTHRDDILTLLLTTLNDTHSSLRAVAVTGLVGLLALNGILSTEQVLLCSDHMIRLALYDLEEGLRKESMLAVSFISEHYPKMFKENMLPSLLDKINIDQNLMDTDDHHLDHVDQSRVLRLICVVSGRHDIASVTLPWLLNYLHTISSKAYNDDALENAIAVMDCTQSIVEHLSVLCDDDCDIDYFKPFLLDLFKLFIDPTLDRDDIIDPHVLTNSTVLGKCAALLRVGVQGVNSKMRSAVAKATKHTFWSLIESPETLSFNPFDPGSPWQQTQLISLITATLSSFEISEVVNYSSQQLSISRNLACHTHHQLTCVHASKLYASIINKLPAGDEMDYCVTVDMDYVWGQYQCDNVDVQIRAVTWWIWTTKALVIRSHPLARTFTVKLLSMFTSADPVAKVASDGIYIILNEVPDLLNSKSHSIIKLMHRQQFFIETVPLLVEQLNGPQTAYKQYYLRALSHVMQAVPKQVLLGELPSLLPLLITSLECPDEGLQVSTLDGVYALIFDAPDVMASYVPTLIPKLLHLAQQAPTMKVRISSLQCLGALSALPAYQVLPYKGEVIQSLEVCLDDKKRLVRKEAVKSRSSWFLLGAVV